MRAGVSRLLIAEMIIPRFGADAEAYWMDMTMMTCAGRERTKHDWEEILEAAGLKLTKIWSAPGTYHGVVEAHLK
jgi:hypothetical protein